MFGRASAGNALDIYCTSKVPPFDGAVGLISIHLAFYQMNPWSTAHRRIINLWHTTEMLSAFLLRFVLLVRDA